MEATIQAFIESFTATDNTATDKNSKFLSIRQVDLTNIVADFKLLSK